MGVAFHSRHAGYFAEVVAGDRDAKEAREGPQSVGRRRHRQPDHQPAPAENQAQGAVIDGCRPHWARKSPSKAARRCSRTSTTTPSIRLPQAPEVVVRFRITDNSPTGLGELPCPGACRRSAMRCSLQPKCVFASCRSIWPSFKRRNSAPGALQGGLRRGIFVALQQYRWDLPADKGTVRVTMITTGAHLRQAREAMGFSHAELARASGSPAATSRARSASAKWRPASAIFWPGDRGRGGPVARLPASRFRARPRGHRGRSPEGRGRLDRPSLSFERRRASASWVQTSA